MSYRLLMIAAASGLAAIVAGCASSSEIRDGARASCVAQNTPEAEMDECIDRMAATIRAAREYRDDEPPPPPPPGARGSNPR